MNTGIAARREGIPDAASAITRSDFRVAARAVLKY